MSKKTKDSFYALWTLAILLCLALSMFVLLFASCSKGGTAATEDGQAAVTDGTENTVIVNAPEAENTAETEDATETGGEAETVDGVEPDDTTEAESEDDTAEG